MRIPLLLLLLLVTCTGRSRLEGRWRGVAVEGVAPEAQRAASEFATGVELEFKRDLIVVHTPKDTQTGKFALLKEDKGAMSITTDKDGPNEPQTFTLLDESTMKWSVLPTRGAAIIFKRE